MVSYSTLKRTYYDAWRTSDISNCTKLQIDSIRNLYPKAFEARKAGIRLTQQVDLAEQRKTLAYLDSMMAVKKASLDSIVGKFVLEKDTAYLVISLRGVSSSMMNNKSVVVDSARFSSLTHSKKKDGLS